MNYIEKKRKPSIKGRLLTALLCFCLGLAAGYPLCLHLHSTKETAIERNVFRPVIRVNDTKIPYKAVQEYLEKRLHVTELVESKIAEGIEEIITMELLYQEAKKRKLQYEPEMHRKIKQLLANKLLQSHIENSLPVTSFSETKTKQYFLKHQNRFNRGAQVRLADIFITSEISGTGESRQKQRDKANEALSAALEIEGQRSGFGMLIRRYSDKHSNYLLGNTGYFGRDGSPVGIEPEVVEAAFEIKKTGDIYPQVIETKRGFHIIMLTGKKAPLQREYEILKPQVRHAMLKERRQNAKNALINDLKKNSRVEVNNNLQHELLETLKRNLSEQTVPPGT